MRKLKIVSALFPEVRTRILTATILRPEKSWYLSELAVTIGTVPSSLQREVESLSEAGILRQWRDGRRLYVAADKACPIFLDLAHLLEKTAGLIPVLEDELASLTSRIRVAFVYGSIAHSLERSHSDIDLMVVGEIGLSDLVPALRKAENRLGRPVNPMIYSPAEFHATICKRDHFLTSVLKGDKLFLKGDGDELAALAEPGRCETAPHQQAGIG